MESSFGELQFSFYSQHVQDRNEMSRWGVSWGIGGIRYGESPNGKRWVSYSILGFRFFKYLDGNDYASSAEQALEPEEYVEPQTPKISEAQSNSTKNENLLENLD